MVTGKANYDSIRLHHSICKDLKIDTPMRDIYWRKKPWMGPLTVSRDQREREGGRERRHNRICRNRRGSEDSGSADRTDGCS